VGFVHFREGRPPCRPTFLSVHITPKKGAPFLALVLELELVLGAAYKPAGGFDFADQVLWRIPAPGAKTLTPNPKTETDLTADSIPEFRLKRRRSARAFAPPAHPLSQY
jgi:hypothetical protein